MRCSKCSAGIEHRNTYHANIEDNTIVCGRCYWTVDNKEDYVLEWTDGYSEKEIEFLKYLRIEEVFWSDPFPLDIDE